jgi:hypothetical protein
MKRALIFTATAVAVVGLSAAPAVAGLVGNASFSHQIPVRVPSGATPAQLIDDRGHDATPGAPSTAGPTSTPTDDHGTPTDDHGGARGTRESEPGDDRGQLARPSATSTARSSTDEHRSSPTDSTTADNQRGSGQSGVDDNRHNGNNEHSRDN